MPTIGKIKAELHGDTRHFDRSMRRSSQRVGRFEQQLKGLRSALVPLTGAFGFGQLIRSTITEADQMAKLSRRLGANIEQFSKLARVMERSNVNIATTAMMMQRLQRRAADAQDGNKQLAAAFEQLGIDLNAFFKLRPVEGFLQVAQALSQVNQQEERMQLAVKLLDSEGAAALLQASLADLRSEMAKTTGYTEEQARAIEQLTDKWASLVQTMKGYAAEEVIGAIEGIAKIWAKLFGPGEDTLIPKHPPAPMRGIIGNLPLTRRPGGVISNLPPEGGSLRIEGNRITGGRYAAPDAGGLRMEGNRIIGGNLGASNAILEQLRGIRRNTEVRGTVLE